MKFTFKKRNEKNHFDCEKNNSIRRNPPTCGHQFIYFCDGKILFFAIKITWWSQSDIFSIETIQWPPFLFLRMENLFYLQPRPLGRHKVVFIAK